MVILKCFLEWGGRFLVLPQTPRAAAAWAAVFVLVLSAYANVALLLGPGWQHFFPPFLSGVGANSNGHLGAEYFYIAMALVRGRGFADPFGVPTGPTAWMPPLYPGVLACLLAALRSHLGVATAVVLLQNATWIASAALVFSLAKASARRLPPAAALAFFALWLLAHFFWFFQVTHDVWIMMLAVDAVLWCGWRLLCEAARARRGLAFGAAGGVALLASPVVGFAFGVSALAMACRRAELRSALALALLLAAAIAAPWAARNHAVFGEWVLVKSNLSYDVYQASFASESGVYDEPFLLQHPVWTTALDPHSLYREQGERAFAATYRARLREALRQHPGAFARKAWNRLAAATLVYRPYRPEIEGPHPLLTSLLLPLPLLGLATCFALGRARRHPLFGFALSLYAGILAPYAILAFYIRYLLPLTPILALFVFWGADAWVDRMGRSSA